MSLYDASKIRDRVVKTIADKREGHAIVGYMDKVDFDYELGTAGGGNVVYASIEDLIEHEPCAATECGIVEVEVRLKEVIKKDDFKTKEGQRMVQVSRSADNKRVQVIGTYQKVDDKLKFIPDDPQPEPEKQVRMYGAIRKLSQVDVDEVKAFCAKYDIKYRICHDDE